MRSRAGIELLQDEVGKFTNVPFGWHIDTAGFECPGCYTLLGHFAHFPVLLVHDVEEFDGVHGVKARPAHDFRLEEPVADHA
jgi:hypothetical protein